MTEMQTATCPACEGTGKTVGYGCPGFVRIEVNCLACKGAGSISAQEARDLAYREAMRKERKAARLARDLSMSEAARDRGIGPIAYNRWERAVDETAPEGWREPPRCIGCGKTEAELHDTDCPHIHGTGKRGRG